MSELHLSGTPKTPAIDFETDPCNLSISGRSIPEDSIAFYKPLMDWVDSHMMNGNEPIEVSIRLEYFNTSSSKCLMDLLKRIEAKASDAQVSWYYEEEDEDMLEAGEDYDAIIDLPFRLIALKP